MPAPRALSYVPAHYAVYPAQRSSMLINQIKAHGCSPIELLAFIRSTAFSVSQLNLEDIKTLLVYELHYRALVAEYARFFYRDSPIFEALIQTLDLYGHIESKTPFFLWAFDDYFKHFSLQHGEVQPKVDQLYEACPRLFLFHRFTDGLLKHYPPSDACLKQAISPWSYAACLTYPPICRQVALRAEAIFAYWMELRKPSESVEVIRQSLTHIQLTQGILDHYFRQSWQAGFDALTAVFLASNQALSAPALMAYAKDLVITNSVNALLRFMKSPQAKRLTYPTLNEVYIFAQTLGQKAVIDALGPPCCFHATDIKVSQYFLSYFKKCYDAFIERSTVNQIKHIGVQRCAEQFYLPLEVGGSERISQVLNLIRDVLSFGNLSMQEGCITRMVTPEFFFYPCAHPFSLEEWHVLLSDLEQLASSFPQNLHALFSSFAVQFDKDSQILLNMVVYVECGNQALLHVFAKARNDKTDLNYRGRFNYVCHMPKKGISVQSDFVAQDASHGGKVVSYVSVFELNEGVLLAVDICADVYDAKSRYLLHRHLKINPSQIIPMYADYLTTETEVYLSNQRRLYRYFIKSSLSEHFFRMTLNAGGVSCEKTKTRPPSITQTHPAGLHISSMLTENPAILLRFYSLPSRPLGELQVSEDDDGVSIDAAKHNRCAFFRKAYQHAVETNQAVSLSGR